MRATIVASVALAFASLAGCGGQDSANSALLGEWRGTDSFGQEMRLIFREGDPMRLRIILVNARGSSEMSGTCTVDLGRSPGHFNIQLQGRDEIRTILSLVDKNTIKFQNIGSSSPRPSDFDDQAMTLTRK